MKKILMTGALAATLIAAPALAQQTSKLDQILNQLDALSKRVERLEQDNARLSTENADLKASNDRLEATSDYLRSNATATRKELAQDAVVVAKIPDLEKGAKSSEWATRILWSGDFRYRYEDVDPAEAINNQVRNRIRARLGFTAKVNDTMTATMRLETNGGNNDPRSANQTVGSGFERKGVAFSLAYADWAPTEGLNVQLGKMPWPFVRVGSYFWDNDISPEGGAVKYASGPFFASAFGYWLSEAALTSDSNVIGAQFGFKGDLGPVKLTGAAMYYDLGAVRNEVTAIVAPTPMGPAVCPAGALNNAFFGGAQGNSVFNNGDNCNRLLDDFNIWEVLAQAEFAFGSMPFVVFGNYAQNTEADEFDTAYAAGFTLGKASNPFTWELGYSYQKTDKNGLFGQFIDSDFAGGITDADGSVIKVAFAPAKNWVLNGTYFLNDRFIEVPITIGGVPNTDVEYKRLQVDFNVKF